MSDEGRLIAERAASLEVELLMKTSQGKISILLYSQMNWVNMFNEMNVNDCGPKCLKAYYVVQKLKHEISVLCLQNSGYSLSFDSGIPKWHQ